MGRFASAIVDADWVKELYSEDPQNPSSKVLVRAAYGLLRYQTPTLLNNLSATKSYADPYADKLTIPGTWRVIKREIRPVNDRELSGSDVLVETLGQGYFTTLSASNKLVVKYLVEAEEQNENAWMYYSRNVATETSRYINVSADVLATTFPKTNELTLSTTLATYDTAWLADQWYEREQDGSYSVYRTLKARSLTSTLVTRAVQYGGMVLVDTAQLPMEGDTHVHVNGFTKQTEVVYANAKLIIGGESYRCTANATAVAGAATVNVSPEISATTEAYADTADLSAVQIYFEALT